MLNKPSLPLAYHSFGQGKNVWVAFHGFGQSAELFQSWVEALPDARILSFDLFFHGKSQHRPAEYTLDEKAWLAAMEEALAREKVKDFNLLAFSLGGRKALRLFADQPERIKRMLLIAPDGFKPNFWYQLTTRVHPVRWLFRRSILRPAPFWTVRDSLQRAGLVNRSLTRLATRQMERRSQRYQVFATWMTYRKLHVPFKEIQKKVALHQPKIQLFAAQYDRLITPQLLGKVAAQLPKVEFQVLPCGHFALPEKVRERLKGERNG